MKNRTALILRHKKSGLFYDKTAGLSSDLWRARRFENDEQLEVFSRVSIYRPDNMDEYETVEVEMTIAIKEAEKVE